MTGTYELPQDFASYDAGTVLREVSLAEARSWECNRCGGCCNGLSDAVRKDPETGFPLFTWGSTYPEDRYRARYGRELLIPLVRTDGGVGPGEDFERDADGKPYTAFVCSMLMLPTADEPASCQIYEGGNPAALETLRPRNCGEFPVFGLDVDATILEGRGFIPHTGALPECTWYGIRVVGPWKEGERDPAGTWSERWAKQQRGEEVPRLLSTDETGPLIARLLERRATVDGSIPRTEVLDRGVPPLANVDPAD